MPDLFFKHVFAGGWATDFGPTANVAIQAGIVAVPWLTDAEGMIFELDGAPHKTPGADKENSSALESGATVMGFQDVFFQGSSGTPVHHRVIHVGTTIKKDDGDGVFTDLFTGLESGKVPDYAMLEDLLVIASNSSTDVPKSWDGSTAQNLAGTPPNFAIVETHQNRMWAAGDVSKPSRLYYSVLLDPADWVGSGSGSIDIDPSDGDRITAIYSHKNRLFVFKGPNKRSIHMITGSAPTGSDAFARQTFITGTTAAGPHAVFPFKNDIGFVAPDGTIRSMAATEAFGDFREAAFSFPIHKWIDEKVNFSKLDEIWTAVDELNGLVLITLPINGSATNNIVIGADFRFTPPRLCQPYPTGAFACLAQGIDDTSSDRRRVYSGGYDGFVRAHGVPNRSIDGSDAIALKVTLPFLDYGALDITKTLTGGSIGFQPHNNGNVTFGWTRDDQAQQTASIDQGGTDVLGVAAANQFTLGTSALGGSRFVDRFFEREEGGEFRAIQFQITNTVNNEDVEFHSIGARIDAGGQSLEN